MDNQETPIEYKDKYQLIFVGEHWSNSPLYDSRVEGRIEIRTWDDEHRSDEICYCTEKVMTIFGNFKSNIIVNGYPHQNLMNLRK